MPALVGTENDWLNTPDGKPLDIAELLRTHHVILVDFWEYTCVNCLRTLPYLKEWNRRYAKDGLVIIGIHTPEFAFAKEHANVEHAVKQLGVTWPVLIDSEYKNWQAFQNNFWPRKFFINDKGMIVADHSGEGNYDRSEELIQRLLKQANPAFKSSGVMSPIRDTDVPGAVCYPTTAELYVGARGDENNQHGNLGAYQPGVTRLFRDVPQHVDGRIYLNGAWTMDAESVHPKGDPTPAPGATTTYAALTYHALGCNAVIKPEQSHGFKVYVTQDGYPVARADRGEDIKVDADGSTYLLIDEPRMYRITKNVQFGSHQLMLLPTSSSFGLYSFTFTSCSSH
jgi:thiol-disulfide isomerase/thioredoxin